MSLALQVSAISSLAELQATLAGFTTPLSPAELHALVRRVSLPREAWDRRVAFADDRFRITPVHRSRWVEMNLIGWRSGQQSAIHNHTGTECCVLVLAGVLTNVDYLPAPDGGLQALDVADYRAGAILTRSDLQIHQCGNRQPPGVDLATLHFYAPPLRPLEERMYSPPSPR